MKKSILFVAALALTFAACTPSYDVEDKTVATFEEAAISPAAPDTVMHLAKTGTFESGNFVFTQEVADYGAAGVYYFGNIVSNKTDKTYAYYADSDKSAAGGAHGGKNYVVWTYSYTGEDGIKLKTPAVVQGLYICNTTWVVDAIKNGDGMSSDGGKPFGKDDKFIVYAKGYRNGVESSKFVGFVLAEGDFVVDTWTYFPLHELGEIDELRFTLSSTKTNDYGMTTPAYFCIDNLGAEKY